MPLSSAGATNTSLHSIVVISVIPEISSTSMCPFILFELFGTGIKLAGVGCTICAGGDAGGVGGGGAP